LKKLFELSHFNNRIIIFFQTHINIKNNIKKIILSINLKPTQSHIQTQKLSFFLGTSWVSQRKTKMEYKRGRVCAYYTMLYPMTLKREEKKSSFEQDNQILKSSRNDFSWSKRKVFRQNDEKGIIFFKNYQMGVKFKLIPQKGFWIESCKLYYDFLFFSFSFLIEVVKNFIISIFFFNTTLKS